MCKAFSCIATRNKVYWTAGMDSHEDIKKKFKLDDTKLGTLAPIEIIPDNNETFPYLYPEKKWTLKFDTGSAPDWWKDSNERMCWDALSSWKKEVYSGINLKEARHPINPLLLPPVKKVTKTQIKQLIKWASVKNSMRNSAGASVGDSVWASVWNSVWDSVESSVGSSVRNSMGNSVGDSVWASVWNSVNDSVGAYISSLFPKVKFKYDFSSVVKLWKAGLVPSFDGNTWRLHTGKDAHIVYTKKMSKTIKGKIAGD